MSKVSSYILNFILFLALVGGVAFCSPSIKGFASSTPSYSGQVTRVFYSSTYSGSPTDGHTYSCKVTNSTWSMSFVGHTGETYSNLTGEVYLLTTSGTYLVGVAGGSNSSVTVANANSSRYYDGYPLKLFGILRGFVTSSSQPAPHSSGTLSFSASVEDTTGTNSDLSSIKSDTSQILTIVQGLNFDSIYDLVSDIWVYLDTNQRSQFANILSTLIDCSVELESIDDSLTELLTYVQDIKRSLCFDFPVSIDGNYSLSDVFFSSFYSSYLNNLNFSIGHCSFDFNTPLSNFYFYFSCPSSHKVRIYSTLSNINSLISAFTYEGTGYSVFGSVFSSSLGSCFEFTIPDSIPTGGLILIRFSTISGRFALYDYVVSANDILDYMKDQWAQSSSAISDLGDHSSGTGTMQGDVFDTESSYFGDFESAVSGAGVTVFNWSVFTGMGIFSAIVSSFYNLMPSELALYITAVLIVGCIAVFISAVGRVVKKGGQDG